MQIPPYWTATQLVTAASCEFAYVRALEGVAAPPGTDPMLDRTAHLGGQHEAHVLSRYRGAHGAGVVMVPRTGVTPQEAVATTLQAVAQGAPVIYQAAAITGEFTGFADFLVRRPDGRYRVQDTKIARSSRVGALLQFAAYADHLRELGVPVDDDVDLILGDGQVATHHLHDVEPVYRVRRARIERLRADVAAGTVPAAWGDERYTACGRCEVCEEQVQATRDLLLVANLSVVQRRVLRAAGLTTIDDLARSTGPVDGIGATALDTLRRQARLQCAAPADAHAAPPFEVIDAEALAQLPEPDAGDLFFDFEGDPLYTEHGSNSEHGGDRWGLDYLFGWVDAEARFECLWAHSFDEERVALRRFLDFVAARRARFPHLHVYHYASYEKAHLISLAARHGEGEEEVADLLRAGVLVDLYPIVRRAVRVGSRSYSIKKLEPLYMGEAYRDEEGVTSALASVDAYVAASAARAEGDLAGWESALRGIADYNEYDCVSTLRLLGWLRHLASEHGVAPALPPPADDVAVTPSGEARAARRTLAARLHAHAGDPFDDTRSADQQALGLVAAAVGFHDREEAVYWGDLYTLREASADQLARVRGVFLADGAQVLDDWATKARGSSHRVLRLTGRWSPGTSPDDVDGVWLLYRRGAAVEGKMASPAHAPILGGAVVEVASPTVIVVRETLPAGHAPHQDLPVATLPGPGPQTGTLKDAITRWASGIADAADAGTFAEITGNPLLDAMRRVPPRTRSGRLAQPAATADGGRDYVGAIVATLRDLDGSYVAVQGPPGTGKTYTAGHVIARLVTDHGWRVGVVAQSHAVIENALAAAARAGVGRDQIAKKYSGRLPDDAARLPWTSVHTPRAVDQFWAGVKDRGAVFGATAWGHGGGHGGPYDLLVVDEAGQFSLAMTAAAQGGARRLLFLGDPQQLPQVTQAAHPEPADQAALTWIAGGHPTLPAHLGYFIETTRRMSPALTAAVSHLQYEGRLLPHPVTRARHLAGVSPGVHPVPVPHRGNVQRSPQEADAVTRIVQDLLGRSWHDEHGTTRPLDERDVIVVTPYNAQRGCVLRALHAAGLHGVRVGTVDKFQGQEAVVAIVSTAASDATEVPRGMEFLIDRNRLNVAISRAQWAAYLVHSPYLVDHVPPTPPGLARLSAFAALL